MGISERPERDDVTERDERLTNEEHREMPPEPVPSPGEVDRDRLDQDVSEQAP